MRTVNSASDWTVATWRMISEAVVDENKRGVVGNVVVSQSVKPLRAVYEALSGRIAVQ